MELGAYAAELPDAIPPLLAAENVYFKNPMTQILEKIAQTKQGGIIETHQFVATDPKFFQALIDARARGVDVALYHSHRLAYMSKQNLQRLRDCGVIIKEVDTHEKTTIIQEKDSAEPFIFTGSANATIQANFNVEVGIMSDDPQLVQDVINIQNEREGRRSRGQKRKSRAAIGSPGRRVVGQGGDRKFHTPKRSKPNCAFAGEVLSPGKIIEDALETIPVNSPHKKEVVITIPNARPGALRSLLGAADKENTHLYVNIDAQAFSGKDAQEKKQIVHQLAEHPHVTLGVFNPRQEGRRVRGKMVPDLLHSKVAVRTAQEGSTVKPLFICSTGNPTDSSRREENTTVVSLMSEQDAAVVMLTLKEIPMEPYQEL